MGLLDLLLPLDAGATRGPRAPMGADGAAAARMRAVRAARAGTGAGLATVRHVALVVGLARRGGVRMLVRAGARRPAGPAGHIPPAVPGGLPGLRPPRRPRGTHPPRRAGRPSRAAPPAPQPARRTSRARDGGSP